MRKTSVDWLLEPEYKNITVLDPDGWDLSCYSYSFYVEQIGREEFEHRLAKSTCLKRGFKDD